MKRLLFFWILIYFTIALFSQDSLRRKNIIAIVPTSILNRTIAVSYYRIFKPTFDVSIKTSMRVAKESEVAHNYFEDGSDNDVGRDDPYWYYNRFSTQIGCMNQLILLPEYFNLFIEPVLHYEFGYFANQTLMVGSEYDHTDVRLDREYNAIGGIILAGLCRDYTRFRLKYFAGVGYSYRAYKEKIYEERSGSYPEIIIYTNNDNTITYYTKHHLVFKVGIELGLKF